MCGTFTLETNYRILSVCARFVDFDKQDDEKLFVDKRKKELKSYYTHMESKLDIVLPYTVKMVVATMLTDSFKFVLELFKFMTKTIVILKKAQGGRGRYPRREVGLLSVMPFKPFSIIST